MKFTIQQHKGIRLTGLAIRVSTDRGRNIKDIPAFWDRIRENGTLTSLCRGAPTGSKFECLGVSLDDYNMMTHEYTYLAAIETPTDYRGLPQGCVDVKIEAGTWAVFECRGALPQAIRNVRNLIIQEWVPPSGYERRPGPEVEGYPKGDFRSPDYYCEVWIPVKKR